MKKMLQIDRVVILAAIFVCLAFMLIIRSMLVGYVSIFAAVFIYLLTRIILVNVKGEHLRIPNCQRSQEALSIFTALVKTMQVDVPSTDPFEILVQFNWARTVGKTVQLGSTILYGLDDIALKGVIAHELGHIKKNHSIKAKMSYLIFLPAVVSLGFINISIFAGGITIILILVGIIAWSFLSWQREFEADAEAAKWVGPNTITHALEESSKFIYRPGGTLDHPSFRNRILRLSPDYAFTDEMLNR
jgi:Zn-dependent protease with chaperone function